ncbi:hypothetical protein FSP39_021479 [Pinctada imbricata]|uniref:Uncharacterized protein n=1 Tax=Pinctada imbricata TaxID=66713 RepID=A0AA88XI48_PINIB|nr:hypothetical protein FSP39_021479 [Pinctada imbricata]
MDMSKGSAYPLLSYDFVKFLLQDDIASQFLQWLNDTYAPEETFYATLNTLPWAPGGYRKEVRHTMGTYLSRAVIWTADSAVCHGKMVRYVCVYGKGDLPWLTSRPQIIANKFDMEFDKEALDCLEEYIRHRTEHPQVDKLNWNYYASLPHVRYYSTLTKNQKSAEYLQMKKKQWLLQQSDGKNTSMKLCFRQRLNNAFDLIYFFLF